MGLLRCILRVGCHNPQVASQQRLISAESQNLENGVARLKYLTHQLELEQDKLAGMLRCPSRIEQLEGEQKAIFRKVVDAAKPPPGLLDIAERQVCSVCLEHLFVLLRGLSGSSE